MPNIMGLCAKSLFLSLYILSLLMSFQHVSSDHSKMDPDEIKNKWIEGFKSIIEDFAKNVLKVHEITQSLNSNRRNNFVNIFDERKEFMRIFQKISVRLSNLHAVLLNLKSTIEKELYEQSHGTPAQTALPLPVCCKVNTSRGQYEGRLRQKVDMSQPCVGTKGDNQFHTEVWASLKTLQAMYKDTPTMLWEYFSTVDGQFIQYPSSNRHCDHNGRLISPLTQEWFVDKLFMGRKNIVIVYDVGVSTVAPVGTGNVSKSEYILEAVRRILDTLTPDDRVNVVAFNDTSHVPGLCDNRLFVANQASRKKIRQYIMTTNVPGGGSDYISGLQKAYNMLAAEKHILPDKFQKLSTQLIFLTAGIPTKMDADKLFTTIAHHQQILDKKVRHFVYTFDVDVSDRNRTILASIANQHSPTWPGVGKLNGTFDKPIGPKGELVTSNGTSYVHSAATYYTQLDAKTKPGNKTTVIVPRSDSHSGLIMTSTIPVFHNNSVYGVAAIDSSMATMFAEVLNFDIGIHSYAFLLESRHGRVLIHPKLRTPGEMRQQSLVFPHLSVVEPTLSKEQIMNLTQTDSTLEMQFSAKMRPGRTSYQSGGHMDSRPLQNATVMYASLLDIPLVIVLVKFASDRYILVPKHLSKDVKLHAPYHRLDELYRLPTHNQPDPAHVCSYDDSYIATDESTIKLSPAVFVAPEKYKYTVESNKQVMDISAFLEHSRNTSLIRLEIREEIEHILRSTDEIDSLWRPTAKLVLERYFGTPTGVLRVFPGMPMTNTFTHLQQLWFKKSVSLPHHLVFTSGQFSRFTRRNIVLMSKAVSENLDTDPGSTSQGRQLEGVVGVAFSHRHLTAMFYQATAHNCDADDVECHLVDNHGYLLTYSGTPHLTIIFPWLATHLIQTQQMKPVWCTSMSEGQHQLSYLLTLTFDHGTVPGRKCVSYTIGSVEATNLFVLVVYNKTKSGCEENLTDQQLCGSMADGQCRDCLTNVQSCERPCDCSADFDQCSSQYTRLHVHSSHFPTVACFNSPSEDDQIPPSFKPAAPGDDVKLCPVPCVSVEEEAVCSHLAHCQWGGQSTTYPTCDWRSHSEIIHQTSQRTSPQKLPSKISTTLHPAVPYHTPGIKSTEKLVPTKRIFSTKSSTASVSFSSVHNVSHNPTESAAPSSGGNVELSTATSTTMTSSTTDGQKTTQDKSTAAGQTTHDQLTITPATRRSTIRDRATVASVTNTEQQTTPGRHNMSQQNRKNQSADRTTGTVVGVIVAGFVVIAIVSLIVYKVRQRRAAQMDSNGDPSTKQQSVLNGAFFKRSTNQAELTTSNQPYEQIM